MLLNTNNNNYIINMNILKEIAGVNISLRPEEATMLCSESFSVKKIIFCFLRLFGTFSTIQIWLFELDTSKYLLDFPSEQVFPVMGEHILVFSKSGCIFLLGVLQFGKTYICVHLMLLFHFSLHISEKADFSTYFIYPLSSVPLLFL